MENNEVSTSANIEEWTPKTKLGKEVVEGKITSIEQIFEEGKKILEPEIVDFLLPGLEHEIILIGGTPGKGGGKRRTPAKRTARMHKSGRRFTTSCLVVVGNKDGYVGVGMGKAPEFRNALEKAIKKAKMNIIPVRRGCGSWECNCGGNHSIPFQVEGKEGSVRVILKPAPKGLGLCASDSVKKVMMLAGIKDIWIKSFGSTQTRTNYIKAVFNALKKLNTIKS
ncbi:MAG TPA: 30S ribosomal protein S5 [Candidatus Aenigmarchaeota archaeon]|nr:30S ribosomal protein S5 [Candidatus Aenigmarchaeota archaeon]